MTCLKFRVHLFQSIASLINSVMQYSIYVCMYVCIFVLTLSVQHEDDIA
jgi:hypothetical protein